MAEKGNDKGNKTYPRKVVRDTHISGYSLPEFTGEVWANIQNIIEIKLSKTTKDRIREIVNRYVEQTLSLHDGANRKALFSRPRKDKQSDLIKFQHFLKQGVSLWKDINQNDDFYRFLSDFNAETRVKYEGRLDLFSTMVSLERLHKSFVLYLKKIQEGSCAVCRSELRQSRSKSITDPEVVYIKDMARLFKELGIKVPKTVSTENTKRTQKFTQVIQLLNELLDSNIKIRIQSVSALEKKIQRYLKI